MLVWEDYFPFEMLPYKGTCEFSGGYYLFKLNVKSPPTVVTRRFEDQKMVTGKSGSWKAKTKLCYKSNKKTVECFWYTLPETNMTPENVPSHMESSIPTIHFQVLC